MRSEDGFAEAAAELAHRIVSSAIWHDGRCNWMGAVPARAWPSGAQGAHAGLGPDLYGGTSGVALFLAEAAVSLDDSRLRATALGAIRHSLAHAEDIDPAACDGLYSGRMGITYAAGRVGRLLAAEEALAGARTTLAAWLRADRRSAASDLDSGCAGGVAALVALTEVLDDDHLRESATILGDELIARAEVCSAGWSWPSPKRRWMHHLCGLSHGAAGVGHALLELHGLTGAARFREAGEGAFEYERSWFDERTGTWPDLRNVGCRARRSVPLPSSDSWCNGTPGIALSRLRAAELLGRSSWAQEAQSALATTQRMGARLLEHRPADRSLCHGSAGLADVLLAGTRAGMCDDGLAIQLAKCSTGRRMSTPGLLLGDSGTGLLLLRLGDDRVRSPLLIHRREP
jgi:lantibiotic biosynthesis protein